MIQSFSAKGHPYDNAIMECFFNIRKRKNPVSVIILPCPNYNHMNGFTIPQDLIHITTAYPPPKLKDLIFSLRLFVRFIGYVQQTHTTKETTSPVFCNLISCAFYHGAGNRR